MHVMSSCHAFLSSFVFHADPRDSPSLPGRTLASSAKGKLIHFSWNQLVEVQQGDW